ncbi:radical SAM protein [Thermodesulfobacteriota bacterium]
MSFPPIKRVLVEEGAEKNTLGSQLVKRLPGIPLEKVADGEVSKRAPKDSADKESIRLTSFKGEFLKPCPGTSDYLCCGYQILNIGTNCPLDCSYCILQAYVNQPSLRIFTNLEEKLEPLVLQITQNRHQIYRLGTGEFTDSLALDPYVRWTDVLLPRFARLKNAALELKTKTDEIKFLLLSPHRDRIVVSWSLNSPLIAAQEEQGAPGIEKRLKAASLCQSEGFVIGFHFDPMIHYPGWEEGYLRTLELLDRYIDPRGVIWISLGALRYMPDLKPIIRRRHPKTHILDGEFVPGLDGKMRYFKPIREAMYAFMVEKLKGWHRNSGIYLCMESSDVWQQSVGWAPGTSEDLSRYLDNRVLKLFGQDGNLDPHTQN